MDMHGFQYLGVLVAILWREERLGREGSVYVYPMALGYM
jgi:hypothetical protein